MTKTKTITTKPGGLVVDSLAAQYMTLSHNIAELTERREELKETVKSLMKDGELKTKHGVFRTEERKTFSWSLDNVKSFFGRMWPAYITVDHKMVRIASETLEPKEATALLNLANVRVTEALTFKEA